MLNLKSLFRYKEKMFLFRLADKSKSTVNPRVEVSETPVLLDDKLDTPILKLVDFNCNLFSCASVELL